MLSQFAWTLRQDPTVKTFTRQHLRAPGDRRSRRVDVPGRQRRADRYDPAGPAGQRPALRAAPRSPGLRARPPPDAGRAARSARAAQGIGPFAVSLHDDQVAATTQSALLVGPVRERRRPDARSSAGAGLLPPAWDFAEPALGGAEPGPRRRGRRSTSRDGSRARGAGVPGSPGEDVRRFLVSRDGVAPGRGPAAGPSADRHRGQPAPLRRRPAGSLSGTRARPIRWSAGGTTRIRDIGWTTRRPRSPCSTRRHRPRPRSACSTSTARLSPDEVTPIVDPGARPSAWRPRRSPATLTPPFAVQPGELFNLAQVGRHEPSSRSRACATSPTRADPQARPRAVDSARLPWSARRGARRLPRPDAGRALRRLRPRRAACCATRAEPASRSSPRPAWPTPVPPGWSRPWAATAYDGVVRAMVVGHKEHRLLALARPLG